MIDYKGAIFDMDGTLLDSMVVWDNVAADYLQSLGITPRNDVREAVSSMSIQQVCEHFCAVYGIKLREDDIIAGINAMVEDFYYNRVTLKAGVMQALSRLRKEGVKMCVATATDRYLAEAALRRTGIAHFFDGIFTCTDVGAGKDEPAIFLQALASLGTPLCDTVVFEDALYAIKTAKASGFRVTALFDPSADAQTDRIKELADCYYLSFSDWNEDNA
ncbi:HAD family phosphatase [Oscillospiraceae bacterium CM]|nr:HAD family phosphatase [Oscillospiraceae bacterium CM]